MNCALKIGRLKKGPLGNVNKKVLTKDIGVEPVSFCLGSLELLNPLSHLNKLFYPLYKSNN